MGSGRTTGAGLKRPFQEMSCEAAVEGGQCSLFAGPLDGRGDGGGGDVGRFGVALFSR